MHTLKQATDQTITIYTEGFIRQVSKLVGHDLMPRKPGRKKKEK